jgi:type I restriction enzyme, S subunit
MKEGWEIKKLGEVCKVIAGQSPESKFYNTEGNGLPFYQGKKDYGENS